MKIRVLENVRVSKNPLDGRVPAGSVLETGKDKIISDENAKNLIKRNMAEETEDPVNYPPAEETEVKKKPLKEAVKETGKETGKTKPPVNPSGKPLNEEELKALEKKASGGI